MPEEKDFSQINTDELVKRGEEIYKEKFQKKYEPSHDGKFLAIETETKKEFLGETSVEATEKAKQEFPDKIFYIKKIGFSAAEVVSAHFPPRYSYDWLF